jgi:hypothetical protein
VHFSLVLTSKSTELIGGLKHLMIGRKPSRMGLLCTSPILCFDLPRPIRAGFFDARIRLVLGLAAGCCENPRQPWSSAAELCHWGIQDSILATIRGPPPRLTVLSLCFVFKLRRLFSIKESLAMRPIWSASQLRRGLQQRHRTSRRRPPMATLQEALRLSACIGCQCPGLQRRVSRRICAACQPDTCFRSAPHPLIWPRRTQGRPGSRGDAVVRQAVCLRVKVQPSDGLQAWPRSATSKKPVTEHGSTVDWVQVFASRVVPTQ